MTLISLVEIDLPDDKALSIAFSSLSLVVRGLPTVGALSTDPVSLYTLIQ